MRLAACNNSFTGDLVLGEPQGFDRLLRLSFINGFLATAGQHFQLIHAGGG